MSRMMVGALGASALFAAMQAVGVSQSAPTGPIPSYSSPWGPPQLAFDIPKAAVDTLLKNAPPAVDQQLRVVDMGKYNLGVGIIHRPAIKDPTPISGPYHDLTAEIYIMLSGAGVLTTGGRGDKKPGAPNSYNILNGPGGNQEVGPGSVSRRAAAGDIIIIPPGVLHAWSKIEDHVTYLSVRPDPDRSLPGGYINPLLMNVKMPDAKP